MLGAMVAQPPPPAGGGQAHSGRDFAAIAGPALLAVVSDTAGAAAAVDAGADLLDLPEADPDLIGALRARFPGLLICGAAPPADLVRDEATARATGTRLICAGLDAARASALPADRLLVSVPPQLVQQAAEAGWAALVDVDRSAARAAAESRPSEPSRVRTAAGDEAGYGPGDRDGAEQQAGIVAMAALGSWLGAAVVRTHHPVPVRRALDMAASIRGLRPPARTVRGLA
jgi:dihydropteroate synthase